MKTIVLIIIFIAFVIYSAEPTISFSPFKVSFTTPYIPFAIICLIMALVLYSVQHQKIGYEQGLSDAVDYYIAKEKEKKELEKTATPQQEEPAKVK